MKRNEIEKLNADKKNMFLNGIDDFIKSSDYFKDMKKYVDVIEDGYRVFSNQVREFDLMIKLFTPDVEMLIEELQKRISDLRTKSFGVLLTNFKFRTFDKALFLEQVSQKLKSGELCLTEVEETNLVEKARNHHKSLLEKMKVKDCDITYKSRLLALMDICPENGVIIRDDRAVLKLMFLADYDEQWIIKIKKTVPENGNMCSVNFSTKEIEVQMPRFFYSAGIAEMNEDSFIILTFKKKTRDEQVFQFVPVFDLALCVVKGFILISFDDEKWVTA